MHLMSTQLARDEFHKKIGGGFPSGSIVLIEGPHGSGKSVLCQRIIYGMLQNGFSSTYVSPQLTTVDFINQMSSLDYKITKELINGSFTYIPIYPLIAENIKKQNFMEKIIEAQSFYEKDVIVFDSLSTIIVNDANPNDMDDLLAFFKRIVGTDKIIMVTINQGELDEGINKQLRLASTVILKLEVKPFGGDLKNYANIVKYNFAQLDYQKVTAFRVEPKMGLIVEITSIS